MYRKKMHTAIVAAALCIGMTMSAYAAPNALAQMEEQSRRAVETAIREGIVPQGSTIYDCAYSRDENGAMIVVRYRDQDGNWIDVATRQPVAEESAAASVNALLTDAELEGYTNEVFEILNREREAVGLAPLARDSLLDEAATIRAAEAQAVHEAGGKPHTRPDGSGFRTVLTDMGVDGDRCAEILNLQKSTPQAAMESWMRSDAHRDIILRERYGSAGVGVYQRPDGILDWIIIFERA